MNNLKVEKGKSSITKKKTIKNLNVDQLQRKPVKSSEASRDLNGYLEPLTHMCTVLNIANESCIRSQEMTLA